MLQSPKLSKTIYVTKNKDSLYTFFRRYENRDDINRTIDLNPDKNGCYTCTIHYLNNPSKMVA